MNFKYIFIIFSLIVLGCQNELKEDTLVVDSTDEYVGGENFTTFRGGRKMFGIAGSALSREEGRLFVAGNTLFQTNWVSAPSSVESLDGVGPLFNATSCGSCHFEDGRGAPPDAFDNNNAGLLFKISLADMTSDGQLLPHPIYGSQLQDRALPTADYEAKINIDYEYITGTYADGETYELRKPIYSFVDFQYGVISEPILTSPRVAPQVYGLGLIDNIDENDILANADINDSDNDGISGKPNYVHNVKTGVKSLGRYGWKANAVDLEQQNAGAFANDMGLTSTLFPKTDWTEVQEAKYPNIINGGTPEISDQQIDRITLYMRTLSVPAGRNTDTQEFLKGKRLFEEINCSSCHIPKFTTSNNSTDITSLNGQSIAPYTDLLLHDMGPQLADNRPDFDANGQEWKTPPLWGLGLVPGVNDHSRYLHDGRARNIEEAILWHGGEAENSKQEFVKLTKQERENIIYFLNSI